MLNVNDRVVFIMPLIAGEEVYDGKSAFISEISRAGLYHLVFDEGEINYALPEQVVKDESAD